MQVLADSKNPSPKLENCRGTLAMIEKFNELIDVMSSRSSLNALWRKNSDQESNNTEGMVECRYKKDKIQVRVPSHPACGVAHEPLALSSKYAPRPDIA